MTSEIKILLLVAVVLAISALSHLSTLVFH